ncbi:helix-turn-helix transcriptional regulator [Actinomadura graeca]|uniref:Helix-turn-helix transcriptional regulator n=1 Tax=Actinomadura graeca TaxID=2750812 RepID=A0ABX8QM03_9ACTN|nr:helix-turn-helix domain-containing protein [Actinomadura graeca]QXJ19709.1 helix-turn-helix transcriptional regulator [Actinomadura graeca]
MGWWDLSTDTLAGSRFLVSPLAEAIAALKMLERGTAAYPSERAWLDVHLPAYRKRLAGDPITALTVRSALGRTWNADFLTPTPAHEGEATFTEEVRAVREAPPAAARDDLTVSLGGPLPAELHRDDLPERTAGLLEWVWTHAVLPDWPRRRRIMEADVVARTAQLSRGGWAEALDGLRPGMRWLGGSRLQINTHDYPPRRVSGARLMFVPVTPRHAWVSWDETRRRFALVYPCSGTLVGAGAPAPEGLGRLLGPARAGVLVLLETPMSTTQLVALTGQGLGSVGRHLKVLLDARLVERRRAGRSVLYYRTTAGEVLVAAQRDG